jgi:phosphoglycerate kinase
MFQFNDILRLDQLDLTGKRVLVRCDLDDNAQDAALPTPDSKVATATATLRWLLDQGISPLVSGHWGRPGARPRLSLEVAGARFAELLGAEVYLPEENNARLTSKLIAELKPGRLLLLENLSWEPGEFGNAEEFARRLVSGVDVFVSDALDPTLTASLSQAPKLCEQRGMGLRLEEELVQLKRALMSEPGRSVWCVGGSFAESAGLLRSALQLRSTILPGAALARTLLAASGRDVPLLDGESEWLPEARTWLQQAQSSDSRVLLPKDLACGSASAPLERNVRDLRPDEAVLDLGTQTVAEYSLALRNAEQVLFLDALGAGPQALASTQQLLQTTADSDALSYVVSGPGLRVSSLLAEPQRLSFVSTSRAGVLALLNGQRVPALEALRIPA